MRAALAATLLATVCGAQTTVNGGRIYQGSLSADGPTSSVDFRTAAGTAPVKTGAASARPTACTQGQIYFATDAAAGQNLSFCTTTGAPGVWAAMTGGGGGATGSGVSFCASGSGSGSAYSCAPNPAVSAYSAGLTLAWVPDVNGSGGAATLNVNSLGAKAVKRADGASDLASADLVAGKLYVVMYDGSVFRVQTDASGGYTAMGFTDMSNGSWRAPEKTVSGLPAASSVTGRVYVVTDGASVGACGSGGGSTRVLCRSTGSNYECIGNCSTGGGGGGSGSPGGSNGQVQYNSSGSFAGQAWVLGGNRFQRAAECSTGTVSYASLTANATSQEVPILTSVPGNFRYHHVLVQEATQVTGSPSLTVSMGTAGVDTDLLLPLALKSAGAPQNFGYETPRPPAVGSGTYNVVLNFVGSLALGNGSSSNFTGGSVNWEVCGYVVQ